MTTTADKVLIGAVVLAVLLVFGFCVKRDADTKRGAQIAIDDSLRKVQDSAKVVAQKKTDSLGHVLDTLVRVVVRVDTAWLTRKVVVNNAVERIVHDSVTPDSTKVRQLVGQIVVLEAAGDSLRLANLALVRSDSIFRVAAMKERLASVAELQTATSEIATLKKLSRHWGLGTALGYGVQRLSDGTIRAGPSLNVGVVYRW